MNEMRRRIFLSILFILSTLSVSSQQTDRLSNSFEEAYQRSNPGFKYRYDILAQTHDYSGNWDLDKDGVKDEVYFVGTGGAHLYYFLRVVLSHDRHVKDFRFIESDCPFLTATDTVNLGRKTTGFVVAELGKKRTPAIIVRLDDSTFCSCKNHWKRKKVRTKNVMVRFENGKVKYGCL